MSKERNDAKERREKRKKVEKEDFVETGIIESSSHRSMSTSQGRGGHSSRSSQLPVVSMTTWYGFTMAKVLMSACLMRARSNW